MPIGVLEMKFTRLFLIFLGFLMFLSCTSREESNRSEAVMVIHEMNEFPEGFSDLNTGYANTGHLLRLAEAIENKT